MLPAVASRAWAVVAAWLLAGIVAGAGLALMSSLLWPPQYTASATTRLVVVSQPDHAEEAMRSAFRQAEIIAELAVGRPQLDLLGQSLDPPMPGSELSGAVTARRPPDQLVITLSVRHEDPERAAEIANAAAASLLEFTNREGQFRIELELIAAAKPPGNASHSYLPRNLAIGVVVGLVAGAVAAIRLRRRTTVEPARRSTAPAAIGGRAIVVGAALGLATLVAMAAQAPGLALQALAIASMGAAALAPGAGLATLAIMLPMPDPPGFTPIGFVTLVIAATAYGAAISALATRSWPRPGRLAVLAIGYLAISAVAGIPGIGGLEGERVVQAIARLIKVGGGILLVGAAWLYFSRHDARPYLALAVAASAFAALLGIVQYVAPDLHAAPLAELIVVPPGVVDVTRATGPFTNPNYYGLFLGLSLVLALGLTSVGGRWRLLGLAALPIGLALLLTFSRGALLAAGAGIFALVWMRSRPAGIALAAAAAAIVVLLVPLLLEVRAGPSYIPAPEDFGDEISDRGRFDAMLSAFPAWLNDPVFGVGFGQFDAESAWYVGSSPTTSSHNEYLSLLAEQGAVGVLLFGMLAVDILQRVLRTGGWLRRVTVASAAAFAAGALIIEPLGSLQASGLFWMTLAATAMAPLVPGAAMDPAPTRTHSITLVGSEVGAASQ